MATLTPITETAEGSLTAVSAPDANGGEMAVLEGTKGRGMDLRTKSVEEAMQPLIEQVTTLSEYRPTHRRGGRSRKVTKLVQIVDKATANFIAVGGEIGKESPDFQEKLLLACHELQTAAEVMHKAGSEFARDTLQAEKRSVMVEAAQGLLMAVTKLMVVADVVDVSKLLKASRRIEEKLQGLREATDEEDLMNRIRECAPDIANITQLATLRQNDLKSEASQQLLAIAQMELNQSSKMLISSSKAFLQHPDAQSAEENRDYIITRMLEALKTIALLADGEDPDEVEYGVGSPSPGELARNFSEFEAALDQSAIAVATSDPSSHQADLQQGLHKILVTASEMAASESTRDYRQHSIITLCGEAKETLQELLETFGKEGEPRDGEGELGGAWMEGELERSHVISECVTDMGEKMTELRKQLRRAMVDHLSDLYADPTSPVTDMYEVAQRGDTQQVEETAGHFTAHTQQLLKVATMATTLSKDSEGNRMVKVAAKHVRTLRPQVVSAARTLAAHPESHVAQKNMAVFKEAWLENVSLLADCIDVIVPLQDFLAVTEAHISEDSRTFLQSLETCDCPALTTSTAMIRGRSHRLARVIQVEVGENPDRFSPEQAREIDGEILQLRDKSLPWFCDLASKAVTTLHTTQDTKTVNVQALEEALQKVNDGVHNVRRAILLTRSPSELEVESDLEDILSPPRAITSTSSLQSQLSSTSITSSTGSTSRKFVRTPVHSTVFNEEDTTRAVMARLPAEQQAHLAKVAEELSTEKAKLETEVNKWEDGTNDIVLLAKEMCMMMMDMSNFTRGLGPLRTTMDVIVRAKDIARAGEYLDDLARTIAEQCPDGQCQKELLVYVERIQLYCHQLKITSAVKADLKTSIRETVDNASALITAAKNLMNAVVQTVKNCYIASTMIARTGGFIPEQVVQWKLAAPKMKLLYSPSESDMSSLDTRRRIGKSPSSTHPIHQLGEYRLDGADQLVLPRKGYKRTENMSRMMHTHQPDLETL